MPLDAAEFISELDIDSPPGTDPLNQGDDQIRTAKRTQLNSFPLVNAAVNISSAQMNQMAIKNEVNIFTVGPQEFQGGIDLDQQGSNNQFRFLKSGVQNWQFRQQTSNDDFLLRRYVAGVFQDNPISVLSANGIVRFKNQVLLDTDGTAGAPSIAFGSSQATGFSLLQSNIMIASVGGSERMRWQTNDATLFTLALAGSTIGSAAVPSYSWFNDRDSGMFNFGGGTVGFAVNSDKILGLVTGGLVQMDQTSAAGGIDLQWRNSAGLPAYSWQYEGTGGFQPGQFSLSRFNRTTGAFIDIPLYINATTGRVHSLLPILSP